MNPLMPGIWKREWPTNTQAGSVLVSAMVFWLLIGHFSDSVPSWSWYSIPSSFFTKDR